MKINRELSRSNSVSLAYDKPVVKETTHPARPRRKPVDIKAVHAKISARYPKVLAELAK